ncbi:MAG: electron transfer flavoprotein subunit alpha/FixB family protein [Clostridiales bacterium]|jgi:electron transfer flavoprotein alpha subunit|nr:electron transfer flavoprotein subunit alpha/FixB family protein [Clostridiales bacterium]
MSDYKNTWVVVDLLNGQVKNVGLELLVGARKLVDASGEKLVAVVIGSGTDEAVKAAVSYGADQVIVVDDPVFAEYTTEGYTYALEQLVNKYKPCNLLIGATINGRDLAPRLAARLKTGLAADCIAFDIDASTGVIQWTRPAYGGNELAVIEIPEVRPQMATVRPSVFKRGEPDLTRSAEIIKEDITVPEGTIRTAVVEKIAEEAEGIKLEDADVVVAGGRGVGGAENFVLLKDLAAALGGGAIGASRAAVDAGWISHLAQIGQTGKTVSPKIYVACGISGAIQHLAGMSGSDVVIAINRDADAPIFEVADYGIVGNLKQVLPLLTEAIRKIKA